MFIALKSFPWNQQEKWRNKKRYYIGLVSNQGTNEWHGVTFHEQNRKTKEEAENKNGRERSSLFDGKKNSGDDDSCNENIFYQGRNVAEVFDIRWIRSEKDKIDGIRKITYEAGCCRLKNRNRNF